METIKDILKLAGIAAAIALAIFGAQVLMVIADAEGWPL